MRGEGLAAGGCIHPTSLTCLVRNVHGAGCTKACQGAWDFDNGCVALVLLRSESLGKMLKINIIILLAVTG